MDLSSLPIDIVGVIVSYTGKLKRRGDSFVTQIDVKGPAYAQVRQSLEHKAQKQPNTPFVDLPFSEMLGVSYKNTFYGYGSASFCRDGDTTWYKITEPWYVCAKRDHPYFKKAPTWL
jgi:hypothetical protein